MSAHIPAGYGTPNTFRNYFTISANPTASVSGRVTSPAGLGLRNVVVTLVDAQDVRRTATTSSFGNFIFEGVAAGQTYTAGAASKRYRFASQVINVNGNLANIDFIGLE